MSNRTVFLHIVPLVRKPVLEAVRGHLLSGCQTTEHIAVRRYSCT